MNKKKIFVVALAVALVAILSLGTLAWFSDSDSVTNDFMIADSNDDTAESVFGVDVYEIDAEDNVYDKTTDGNGISYNDVLPNSTLVKKAYVENTGHYDQYVRVIITISDKAAWMASVDAANETEFMDYDVIQHFEGFKPADWDLVNSTCEYVNDTIVYTLYKKDTILAGTATTATVPYLVFEKVNIPSSMTREDALLFDEDGVEGFTIDVQAQAVQAENVGDTCFAAFQTVEATQPF